MDYAMRISEDRCEESPTRDEIETNRADDQITEDFANAWTDCKVCKKSFNRLRDWNSEGGACDCCTKLAQDSGINISLMIASVGGLNKIFEK